MSWYKTGTVTVTNGSTAVTGAGTLFVGAVSAGDAFVGPTGQVYEVVAVISATQLTISPSYQGSSQPGAAYGIFPTYAALVSFNTRLNALLVNYESVLTGAGAGKFLNGTAAAPGVSFVGDTDTGVRWVSSNTLALVTGGADRVVVSNSAMEVKVPVTGAAVQSSPTDFTPGKIMLTGSALAINTLPVIGNASVTDNSIKTGFYAYQVSGGAVSSGGPAGASFGNLLHSRRAGSGGEAQMLFVDSGSAAAPPGSIWSRWRLLGDWSPWVRHYTQSSVLGAVSQSGGVPTGALIETGSNANGRWEKYANGTMNVTRTILNFSDVTVASGNIFQSLEVPFDFPVTFIEPPVVSLSVRSSSSVWGNGRPTSNNAGVGRLYAPISIAGLVIVDIEVTGRWF